MIHILQLLGIVLALVAASTSVVGSIKATPLVPGYADRVRHVLERLDGAFRPLRDLTSHLLDILKHTGRIECQNLDTQLLVRLEAAAEGLGKMEVGARSSDPLDFEKESLEAARARIWIVVGVICAGLSATCQISALVAALRP